LGPKKGKSDDDRGRGGLFFVREFEAKKSMTQAASDKKVGNCGEVLHQSYTKNIMGARGRIGPPFALHGERLSRTIGDCKRNGPVFSGSCRSKGGELVQGQTDANDLCARERETRCRLGKKGRRTQGGTLALLCRV